jgi:hypothetical protein
MRSSGDAGVGAGNARRCGEQVAEWIPSAHRSMAGGVHRNTWKRSRRHADVEDNEPACSQANSDDAESRQRKPPVVELAEHADLAWRPGRSSKHARCGAA